MAIEIQCTCYLYKNNCEHVAVTKKALSVKSEIQNM